MYAVCHNMCVISNLNTSRKPYYVSDHSKLDALLHKTLSGITQISLSEIAHKMWRNHQFSQRNMAIKRAVVVMVGEVLHKI